MKYSKIVWYVLQVVVTVGSSMSGQDISMELIGVAKEIYVSARSPISLGFDKIIAKHTNLHLCPQVTYKSPSQLPTHYYDFRLYVINFTLYILMKKKRLK